MRSAASTLCLNMFQFWKTLCWLRAIHCHSKACIMQSRRWITGYVFNFPREKSWLIKINFELFLNFFKLIGLLPCKSYCRMCSKENLREPWVVLFHALHAKYFAVWIVKTFFHVNLPKNCFIVDSVRLRLSKLDPWQDLFLHPCSKKTGESKCFTDGFLFPFTSPTGKKGILNCKECVPA